MHCCLRWVSHARLQVGPPTVAPMLLATRPVMLVPLLAQAVLLGPMALRMVVVGNWFVALVAKHQVSTHTRS